MRIVPPRVVSRTVLGTAAIVVVTAALVMLAPRFQKDFAEESAEASPIPASQSAEAAGDAGEPRINTVQLTRDEIEAAGIRLEAAQVVDLTESVTVPGTIEPDPNLQVAIRPRVVGVIRSVEVSIGQRVEAGDLLAVLDSVEVGGARLDLRARRRELAQKRAELEWEATVAENVEQLSQALDENIPAAELERRFARKPLGDERAMLLGAYANLEAARLEEERQASLVRDGVVGDPKLELARRDRMAAQATFEAALEQVRYESRRTRRLAEMAVRMAEAAVADTRQRLEILGIEVEQPPPDADPLAEPLSRADDLTAYHIRAPFAGTIVTKTAVPSQRAAPTDVLMELVDLAEVHVIAQVPESQFGFLPGVDETIRFTAVAYPGRDFEARVHSIGAVIDEQTRTVPIHAHVSNPDGLLRLGMFVTIELTRRESEETLTVPAAAVVEIDQKPGVFVPGESPDTFVLHPVTAGRRAGDRRVILDGLKPGQQVVAEGAFLLKSELILQNEPEED